ncbi:MAG TPA: carbohydrate binding domain-containing protein, partial [Treponemataceae bacterium]|nr:carbohydrate binding domain-containing protein [Treponemataceae bacterium]
MKRKSILFTCLTAASVFFALMPIAGCDFGSNTTDTETPDPDAPADPDPEEPVETERIENGDFADGFVLPWSAWNGEGGASTQTVTGGELVVTVTAPGTQPYSVQIFQDGLSIPDGEQTVSFRAKAAEPRLLRVQLGKGLSADPWFVEFMHVKSFDLTTEWQDFSFTFNKSNSTYSDGKLVFELGTMTGEGTLATDVSIDDVSLVNLDSGTPAETPGEFVYPAVNADSWTPGDGWTLSWQDEFNDGAFDTNTWTRQTMLNPPNNEWQQYFGGTSNDNAWEEDGYMVL